MTEHKARTTAALLKGADASAAMPHVTEHPTEAMKAHRLALLWKTAGAIAYIEHDRGAFGELLEAVGLLPYEAADSGKHPERAPLIKYPVRGQ